MVIVKSKIMQNLVVLMEPSEKVWSCSLKAGNMILNRFCIDEDSAFELSGVNYLKKTSMKMNDETREFEAQRKVKGKDFSCLRFETFLIN